GGILLLLISIDMLFARPSRAKKTPAEEMEAKEHEQQVAVFPLAIPMIAGPGTIATVLLLVNLSHGDRAHLAMVFVAFALALFVTWLVMRYASVVMGWIGKTGVAVLTRLLG